MALGIDTCFSSGTVEWKMGPDDKEPWTIPMKPNTFWQDPFSLCMCLLDSEDDDDVDDEALESYAAALLDSKYEEVDVEEVVAQQQHLTEAQRKDLADLLHRHTALFSGKIGTYPYQPRSRTQKKPSIQCAFISTATTEARA